MERNLSRAADAPRGAPEGFVCDYARFFPFWNKLTTRQQTRLAGYCTVREFRAGENIYFHQICNGGMYFVYTGAIRIYMISPSGREATIYHRYPGQTGIIVPLYESKPENIIPVFQAEQDSVLAYLAKADMYKAAQELLDMQELYMNVTAECVQEVVNAFFSFAFLPLKSRVARILLEQARAFRDFGRFVVSTHDMIASATGTSREVATRTLGRMEDEGILRTGRRQIEILDVERLEELASI